MIYYQDSSTTIEWDDLTGAVISTRTGFVKGDPYRRPLDKAIELIKEKKAHKCFIDDRNAPVIDPVDLEWFSTNWGPRAIAAGLRWMAVVMPSTLLAKMQIDRKTKASPAPAGTEMRYFDHVDEAKTWLRSVR